MSITKEFKEFVMRGNVIDLAVGVIIGGAFGAIITSLVSDIVMPLIGIITGGVDFTGMSFNVGSAKVAYGKFIQAVFVFTIVSFVLFLIIKAANAAKKKEAVAPTIVPELTKEEQLLTEIRDVLKKNSNQ